MNTLVQHVGARAHGSGSASSPTSSPPRFRVPVPDRWPCRSSLLVPLLALLISASLVSGCAVYSFSGASIPSNLETISIPIVQDNTSSPANRMGTDLTDLLTDRFVDRTRLSLTTDDSGADALLRARIQRYTNQPTGVSGNERATTNEVTIEVQVRYVDQTKDEELLNQTFSGQASYNPAEAGLTGEQQAAQNALENVADDIFSSATSNW
ncbi:MAG: hypothetical protein BRD27_04630 [Bacteroidetes bacterium QH_10_64_19]|nr:MAG: hypothetical protein BRD27_04630 [Bacteroidetes bacterium QH_10_64_19]